MDSKHYPTDLIFHPDYAPETVLKAWELVAVFAGTDAPFDANASRCAAPLEAVRLQDLPLLRYLVEETSRYSGKKTDVLGAACEAFLVAACELEDPAVLSYLLDDSWKFADQPERSQMAIFSLQVMSRAIAAAAGTKNFQTIFALFDRYSEKNADDFKQLSLTAYLSQPTEVSQKFLEIFYGLRDQPADFRGLQIDDTPKIFSEIPAFDAAPSTLPILRVMHREGVALTDPEVADFCCSTVCRMACTAGVAQTRRQLRDLYEQAVKSRHQQRCRL